MKVLHVGRHLPPTMLGGFETILRNLLDLTSGDVENIALVADPGPADRVERLPGCEIHHLRKRGDFLFTPVVPSMPRVLRGLLAGGVDVLALHFPNPMAAFACLLARPFRGPEKLIVFYHSEIAFDRFPLDLLGRIYSVFERILLRRADRIVVSNASMRDASPQIPRYREKTRIVHYALEEGWTVLDPRQEREAEGFRAGFGRFVLFVGRLVAYKGLETLLDAAPRIRGRIVVVGDGPLRGLLAGRIAREGLGDKVFLAGAVDDAKPWFAACALLVLPSVSRLETFGIVQIEAMAFGKPCVSSDLPTGVTDINEHEVTGLACPPGAPDALADAINRLLDDPGLRARLGEQARGKVLREHSPRAVRQELLELYREVAAP